MNKRIQELAEQAGLQPYYDAQKEQIAKFAELIVRECMTTILKESKWYWDKDKFESSNAIQNAAMKVKEHFGVK